MIFFVAKHNNLCFVYLIEENVGLFTYVFALNIYTGLYSSGERPDISVYMCITMVTNVVFYRMWLKGSI